MAGPGWRPIAATGLGLLSLGLLSLGLAACMPMPARAPAGTPAHAEAWRRVHAAIAAARADEGALEVGWGRAELAIPLGPSAGYAEAGPVRAQVGALAARAIAVRVVGGAPWVWVTADVLAVPADLAPAVRRRLGADAPPAGRLLLSASHTHSGPGGWVGGVFSAAFGPYRDAAREGVERAYAGAARQALARLAPGRVGVAGRAHPGVGVARSLVGAELDEHVWLLLLERASDGARAAMWTFGVHPVTWPRGADTRSADYPGALAARLEGHGLDQLGFAAGAVGGCDPIRRGEGETEALAARLEPSLRAALDGAARGAVDRARLAVLATRIPLPPPAYRPFDAGEGGLGWMLWPELVRAAVGLESVPLAAVRIGDALIVPVPAEPSGPLGARLRRHLGRHGAEATLVAFGGDWAGYLSARRTHAAPPERRARMWRYETRRLALLGPWGEDLLLRPAVRLAEAAWAAR